MEGRLADDTEEVGEEMGSDGAASPEAPAIERVTREGSLCSVARLLSLLRVVWAGPPTFVRVVKVVRVADQLVSQHRHLFAQLEHRLLILLFIRREGPVVVVGCRVVVKLAVAVRVACTVSRAATTFQSKSKPSNGRRLA